MGLKWTTRPISDWTGLRDNDPKHSLFTVTWRQTVTLLEREVEQLGGGSVILELDCTESDIRLDGQIRADARIKNPAARILFESRFGPISMGTAAFVAGTAYRRKMDHAWQHNVYAIAKALEALRMVDRYGVTKRGEQYTGWKAIGSTPIALTPEQAVAALASVLDLSVAEVRNDLPKSIRRAKARAHPDRNHGARAQWDQVEEAARALGITT